MNYVNSGEEMVVHRKTNVHLKEKVMGGLFFSAALISVAAVLLICLFLFINGVPAIKEIGFFDFVANAKWAPMDVPASYGILSMIVGSLYVTAGAVLIGVPIGIMCAVFLAYFCPKRLHRVLKPAVDLLAGIPSIIYGFFGMQVIVPLVRDTFGGSGYSIMAASILLGVMMLPTVITISESSLRVVPKPYYEGALALGATHEEGVFNVMVPSAKSGILTSVILGIGRVIGETMAVIMVAGNAVMPLDKINVLKPIRTLTANIVTEMSYSEGLHTQALISTGVVLFVFILLLNLALSVMKSRRE